MAIKDSAAKEFFTMNEVFASLVNFVCYEAKEVIKASSLIEKNTNEFSLIFEKEVKDKQVYRDLLKEAVIKETKDKTYVLFGLEAQVLKDPYMITRVMLYDAINYYNQAKGVKKPKKLKQVITIVFYLGKGVWNKNKSLYDVLEKPNEKFINLLNYHLILLSPKTIEDREIDKIKDNNLKALILCLKNQDNVDSLTQVIKDNEDAFNAIDKKVLLLLDKNVNSIIKLDQGEVNMLNVFSQYDEYFEAKGLERGFKKGLEQGLEKGREAGFDIGRAEGHAEGHAEGVRNTAKSMKNNGFSTSVIEKITGISKEEIDKF